LKLNRCSWAALLAAAATSAHAGDLDSLGNLAQSEFRSISEDLGAALSYKGVTPATPLGLAGIDVGLEVTWTRMENSRLFQLAGAGSLSDLVIPKLHVHKGLIGGLDIGAFVSGVPQIGVGFFGAELRYAVLDDTLTTPAVGLRVSGTTVTGLSKLRFKTAALDAVVSKKFALATPYIGVGTVHVMSEAKDVANLSEETFNKSRVFTGVNMNFAVVNVALEAEKLGNNTSLSAKLGWRF
jgi:hypothetical protein